MWIDADLSTINMTNFSDELLVTTEGDRIDSMQWKKPYLHMAGEFRDILFKFDKTIKRIKIKVHFDSLTAPLEIIDFMPNPNQAYNLFGEYRDVYIKEWNYLNDQDYYIYQDEVLLKTTNAFGSDNRAILSTDNKQNIQQISYITDTDHDAIKHYSVPFYYFQKGKKGHSYALNADGLTTYLLSTYPANAGFHYDKKLIFPNPMETPDAINIQYAYNWNFIPHYFVIASDFENANNARLLSVKVEGVDGSNNRLYYSTIKDDVLSYYRYPLTVHDHVLYFLRWADAYYIRKSVNNILWNIIDQNPLEICKTLNLYPYIGINSYAFNLSRIGDLENDANLLESAHIDLTTHTKIYEFRPDSTLPNYLNDWTYARLISFNLEDQKKYQWMLNVRNVEATLPSITKAFVQRGSMEEAQSYMINLDKKQYNAKVSITYQTLTNLSSFNFANTTNAQAMHYKELSLLSTRTNTQLRWDSYYHFIDYSTTKKDQTAVFYKDEFQEPLTEHPLIACNYLKITENIIPSIRGILPDFLSLMTVPSYNVYWNQGTQQWIAENLKTQETLAKPFAIYHCTQMITWEHTLSSYALYLKIPKKDLWINNTNNSKFTTPLYNLAFFSTIHDPKASNIYPDQGNYLLMGYNNKYHILDNMARALVVITNHDPSEYQELVTISSIQSDTLQFHNLFQETVSIQLIYEYHTDNIVLKPGEKKAHYSPTSLQKIIINESLIYEVPISNPYDNVYNTLWNAED